jgi:hypothetical protein
VDGCCDAEACEGAADDAAGEPEKLLNIWLVFFEGVLVVRFGTGGRFTGCARMTVWLLTSAPMRANGRKALSVRT